MKKIFKFLIVLGWVVFNGIISVLLSIVFDDTTVQLLLGMISGGITTIIVLELFLKIDYMKFK